MTTYIPLAEKHGVDIIADAPVERIIIEKKGARPTASGIVYKQRGQSVELRGSKIMLAAGVIGTPRLLFKSGYGPKDQLGKNVIVENPNIGKHLDGHAAIFVQAYFDEPIKDGSRGAAPGGFYFFDDAGPNAYGRVRIKDSSMIGVDPPWELAFSPFAPEFGREHKAFMKKARMHRGGTLVEIMKPEGYRGSISLTTSEMEYEGNQIIEQRLRAGGEISREVLQKMGAKKIVGYDMPPVYFIAHGISTCKPGKDPKTSVVNCNFESHDVDNLFICDASVQPRAASGDAVGPLAVISVLASQRIIANHFKR
jgi:choline dehydrogenase-like flavoprotein